MPSDFELIKTELFDIIETIICLLTLTEDFFFIQMFMICFCLLGVVYHLLFLLFIIFIIHFLLFFGYVVLISFNQTVFSNKNSVFRLILEVT